MFDLTLLVSTATLALLLALLIALPWWIRRSISKFKQTALIDVQKIFFNWAFVVTEEEVKGVRRHVARPSPALLELMNQVMPVVITKGLEWAKANVKLGGLASAALGGGQPGGAPGFQLSEKDLKFIPKELRGLAAAFGPGLLARLMPKPKPESSTAENPFIGELSK